MTNSPLIPAKAGTQAEARSPKPVGVTRRGRMGPRLRGDERIWGAVTALGFGTPALAHEGHHEQMPLAQALRHLLSQPDHLLMVAALVVVIAAGGWTWLRRAPK
jgi:hypothetical protein